MCKAQFVVHAVTLGHASDRRRHHMRCGRPTRCHAVKDASEATKRLPQQYLPRGTVPCHRRASAARCIAFLCAPLRAVSRPCATWWTVTSNIECHVQEPSPPASRPVHPPHRPLWHEPSHALRQSWALGRGAPSARERRCEPMKARSESHAQCRYVSSIASTRSANPTAPYFSGSRLGQSDGRL